MLDFRYGPETAAPPCDPYLLALVLALATVTASRAADDPVLAEATDLTGAVMFLNSGAPGMVLVVVRGDRTLVRGYGETGKGNKHAPDGTSLLRLNSITKVFTTEVLVSLAAEGKLTLTDPLQRFAGGAKVPEFGTHAITLLDLATHSAALPREMSAAPEDANPRARPTREDRWKWLPDYKLPWASGTIAACSNAGSGLGGAASCVDTHATDGSGGLYSSRADASRHSPVLSCRQGFRPEPSQAMSGAPSNMQQGFLPAWRSRAWLSSPSARTTTCPWPRCSWRARSGTIPRPRSTSASRMSGCQGRSFIRQTARS